MADHLPNEPKTPIFNNGQAAKEIYSDNQEFLFVELERIRLIVYRKIREWRQNSKNTQFPGLYISEEEVDSILERENKSEKRLLESQAEDILLQKQIEAKKSASTGLAFRLDTAVEMFGLSQFEVDAVLLVLAAEIDLKYGKLFAYLQDDVTKRRATVGLIIDMFCQSRKAEVAARNRFSENAPLIRNHIFHLQDGYIPLLEKTVKLDDRIVGFLLGSNELDYIVASFSSIEQPRHGLEELAVPAELKQQLAKLAAGQMDSIPLFLLQGSFELLEVAEALCHKVGRPVLIADLEKIKTETLPLAMQLLFREAKLQKAAIYLDKLDLLDVAAKRAVLDTFDKFDGLAFVPSRTELSLKNRTVKVVIPKPLYVERLRMWQTLLGDFEGIGGVASRFKFGRTKAAAALAAAKSLALLRNPSASCLTLEDLYACCRAQLNPITLATKITSNYKWDDIVLPPDKKEQLKEICNQVKHYATVYESWGFDKHSRGRGLNVLFSGQSGTGKTMAAEIIAGELGLDMYKIDLSVIVSKYIGETEKNLNRIFKEAEESNAILFFDEADALFGKRSEVKDAHDRYANIEINYLLQKMEEHEGIVILATNLSKNLDDAFVRRMNFVVEFPFPTESGRLAIWKQIFPKQAPLDTHVDFEFLSKLLLSGGNIKNIALTAAFLAAEDAASVQMEHIAKAVKREYQKTGKIIGKDVYGKYCKIFE